MNPGSIVVVASLVCLPPGSSYAQVAGKARVGVTVVQMEQVVLGWSAKRDILDKPVYNDAKQEIGEIHDVIITPSNAVSFAIVGVGGFLGIGKKDVVIPMGQIQIREGNMVLPGATKDTLKALPKFEYLPNPSR